MTEQPQAFRALTDAGYIELTRHLGECPTCRTRAPPSIVIDGDKKAVLVTHEDGSVAALPFADLFEALR